MGNQFQIVQPLIWLISHLKQTMILPCKCDTNENYNNNISSDNFAQDYCSWRRFDWLSDQC